MLKIHGTPMSGSAEQAAKFYRNRHALVSFEAQQHLAVCLAECASVVGDSGAFKVWRAGGEVDYDAYIAWSRNLSRHPRFAWSLIPDVIDGDEAENDMHLAFWPSDVPGVPVFHMHESLERAERLAKTYPMIALGSSGQWRTPGTSDWWTRMAEIMGVICDDEGRPYCKLHGLRMLNPAIFTRLPLAGADSANAGINAGSKSRFGSYIPPSAWVRAEMIADRIEAHNSAAVWTAR